jgi:carboxylate-amine ligase
MTASTSGFRFGLEAEFMLIESGSCRPLWHPQLRFDALNSLLESIDVDTGDHEGLDVRPPHRKPMPFVVEGYQVPGPNLRPTDLLPKGVEIRTPVRDSIEDCLASFKRLHARLEQAFEQCGYRTAALSFHPTQDHFEGPQNKKRYDHWQWAMEAMTTYGPDVNVTVPSELAARLDLHELHGKVNYYAPALTALSLASPLYCGDLWRIRGRIGKSVRTHHRSTIAPAISIHPKENLRLEFKPFEMSRSLSDYHCYFLLWLTLIVDEKLQGRATEQTRIYDMGQIAQSGLDAETVRARAHEVLTRAPEALEPWGFDCAPLRGFVERLQTGRLPADEIIELFEREKSIPGVLRGRVGLIP